MAVAKKETIVCVFVVKERENNATSIKVITDKMPVANKVYKK